METNQSFVILNPAVALICFKHNKLNCSLNILSEVEACKRWLQASHLSSYNIGFSSDRINLTLNRQ